MRSDGGFRDEGQSAFALEAIALDTEGVHEIKPAFEAADSRGHQGACGRQGDWAAATSAAFAFFAALIARRLAGVKQSPGCGHAMAGGLGGHEVGGVLWCFSRAVLGEYGRPYIHGLEALGLAPDEVMIAETGNTGETLWALEEGMRSRAPVLVGGIVDEIGLTPARRLALGAKRHGVPCLILSDARSPPVAAAASRWRVGAAPGGCNELEGGCQARGGRRTKLRLLGARRFAVALERYRRAPMMADGEVHLLEWRDEAVCFDLVSEVPDRSVRERSVREGASG